MMQWRKNDQVNAWDLIRSALPWSSLEPLRYGITYREGPNSTLLRGEKC
jgi:hypothetical protein